LGIALDAVVAGGWKVLEHLRQALLALTAYGRWLGGRTVFATTRSTALVSRARRFRDLAGRPFPGFDRLAVEAEMANQLLAHMRLDQRFMHSFGQL
jgi:hypothetical protein